MAALNTLQLPGVRRASQTSAQTNVCLLPELCCHSVTNTSTLVGMYGASSAVHASCVSTVDVAQRLGQHDQLPTVHPALCRAIRQSTHATKTCKQHTGIRPFFCYPANQTLHNECQACTYCTLIARPQCCQLPSVASQTPCPCCRCSALVQVHWHGVALQRRQTTAPAPACVCNLAEPGTPGKA